MVEDEIREYLRRLCAQMRKNYAETLRVYQIHVGQEHALCQLWMEEGITQLELSQRMEIEPPTATNMLRKLEEYGWVYRKRDPQDGRVSRVYLTDEGRALQKPVQDVWKQQQEKLLDGISSEEKLILRRLMRQMMNNLEDTDD
ncbi:MarR family transcriptional regulator [Ammoniphilus oxalaticus]|uniref:MarR family transcriptional regulator n=1 Tax=Ammoniphilus oxalaticus TaxID=66863 RepID=A0A419SNN8_9BACL|nr:MarR family transcriptional regulator [Ammoniphilus oxalaticus]RKD25831.1 MarR family transcriptional regulator [Ammoniphilus oxalaticus]